MSLVDRGVRGQAVQVLVTVDVPHPHSLTALQYHGEGVIVIRTKLFGFCQIIDVDTTFIDLNEDAGTIFIDGRITKLSGDVHGRLTIVGNEKVRLTGSIRYVDGDGDTAMLHGDDYTRPYERNPDYDGNSVLGVIARGDVLFTRGMPQQAELNATLMSADGRVGIDGFRITAEGEPDKGYLTGLSNEEQERERAYNRTSDETRRFRRESLRRIGSLISNDRILETYMRRRHGTSTVDSGFKRGSIRFDVNLLFDPPPNFAEMPRPVTHYAPAFMRDSAT